jgi:hypothetical protein
MTIARDKIAEIMYDNLRMEDGIICGIEEAVDAILAAQPDMIAPLVWKDFDRFMTRSGYYKIIKAPFESHWRLFFVSKFLAVSEDRDTLVVNANAHHRDEFRKLLKLSATGEKT